jgi:hypothetical protein
MRLTNTAAQRLLFGLKQIDVDAETKLDPDVRFAIAINITRLSPNVQQFERVLQRLDQEQRAALLNGKPIVRSNGEETELIKLLDSVERYKLKSLTKEQLRLKDNPKIKSDLIAAISPIIKQFDDGEGDEDEGE